MVRQRDRLGASELQFNERFDLGSFNQKIRLSESGRKEKIRLSESVSLSERQKERMSSASVRL